MGLIQPDFSEVADQIEPGEYAVRITGSEFGEYQSGTKYVKWELTTFNEAEPKNNGRKIWERTPTHGKGAFRLQQFYKAATNEALKGNFDTEQLHGKEMKVVVVDGVNKEGAPTGYTEVKSYMPLQA